MQGIQEVLWLNAGDNHQVQHMLIMHLPLSTTKGQIQVIIQVWRAHVCACVHLSRV